MVDFDWDVLGDYVAPSADEAVSPFPDVERVEFHQTRKMTDTRGVEITEYDVPVGSDGKPQPVIAEAFDKAWDLYIRQAEVEAHQENHKRLIAETEDEIKRVTQTLRDRVSQLKSEMYDFRGEARRLELLYQSALRQLALALDNYRQQQSFIDAAAEFDRITANAPWRDRILPHQLEGAKMLAAQKRGILADKMGLGKTLTSIATADMVRAQKVLVVVPADVIRNYEREIAYWAPHRHVLPLGRLPREQRKFALMMLKQMDSFVVTVNYEAWRRDQSLLSALIDLQFDMVIADEAHVMKSTSSAAAIGLSRVVHAENSCPECGAIIADEIVDTTRYGSNIHAIKCQGSCGWSSQNDETERPWDAKRSVKYMLPMTGTPILNKPEDLYPLLNLVDPVGFDTISDFRRDFLMPDSDGKYKFRPGGMESLAIRLGTRFIARDKKSAGVILPPQKLLVHDIDFDKETYPKQWKVIEDLTKHAGIILESGDGMDVLATIALITRQRQANVWPAGIEVKDPITGEVTFSVGSEVTESLKLDRVEDIIDDYVSDERIVVFSQFKTPLRELERRLSEKGISVACFDGSTPEHLREEIKIDFDRKHTTNGNHKYDVVLCNYKTGGVGLNFTNATQMIILDEEWNPGKRDQAYARVDRVGQTEESQVHVLRINNTVDTWLASLIGEKEEMIDGFETQTDLRAEYLKALQNGMVS